MESHLQVGFLLLWCACVAASPGPQAAAASVKDLHRAATRVPRDAYRGASFADMNLVLNRQLMRTRGLSTRNCSSFTVQDLQKNVLEPIFRAAHPELLAIYALHGDRRQRTHSSLEDLQAEWALAHARAGTRQEFQDIQRDGLCHEAVMWFVHHLSEKQRQELQQLVTLPLLPIHRHELETPSPEGVPATAERVAVHAEYTSKVSCQQCHTGPISKTWTDATLPLPLPVDVAHPGRERLRNCDYQNKPTCGPCDGLGGPRWGDGAEQFTPVNCTVVAAAGDVPPSSRPRPAFPNLGRGRIHGETRHPLAVRMDPKKPGKYSPINASIALAWDDKMMRHRYDFEAFLFGQPATQIYLQTPAQVKSGNSSGAMVTILGREGHIPSLCICTAAVAGLMHVEAFVPHESLDPLDLPPEEGGLTYLGRIKLDPIDGPSNRTVIADHYMKWAFHFLVDVDPTSAGYGLPARLYATSGVRMVYSDWKVGDPREDEPDLFKLPSHCLALSQFCKELKKEPQSASAEASPEFV